MKKRKNNKIKNTLEPVLPPLPSYFAYIPALLLLLIFVLSLYIRAVLPYEIVFANGIVHFSSDDGVYHMRLVENTLQNFPHRLTYDLFTRYPTGEFLHWGPLFTLIIASLSMIIGLGHPSIQLTNTIGAFTPAIMGALVVFPVYYIAKHIFNSKSAGILSALMIAVLPGQFLSRSVLGFTDHHVAEVLFSTTTMAMYIFTLRYTKSLHLSIDRLNLSHNSKKEKFISKYTTYSILTGIMLSAYLLTWPGAPFFIMIMFIYIFIQSIIDVIRKEPMDYLVHSTVPMMTVTLIFLLPFVNTYGFIWDKYSLFHIMLLIIGILLPIVLFKLSKIIKSSIEGYIVSLLGIAVIGLLLIKSILPNMYASIVYAPSLIFTSSTGGKQTIAEAVSILERPGMMQSSFPISLLTNDTLITFFILITLSIISFKIITKKSAHGLVFVIWTLIMFIAMYGQNRWAYYFAVNFALLCGFVGGSVMDWHFNKHAKPLFEREKKSVIIMGVVVSIILLMLVYPSFNISLNTAKYINNGDPSGGGFNEWYESLTWMRNNTPDTGIDYFSTYENHIYPATAYGIMSWWDYGHIITYYAHRIPTANPFQSGIGSKDAAGASSFLTAKTEGSATKVLQDIGDVRYVITNSYMAYEIMGVFGVWAGDAPYFTNVRTSKGDQVLPARTYYDNMASRLHIFDGSGLKNYRMVHESNANPNTQGGYREQQFKYIYNMLYGGTLPVENSGLVKIFEFVPGAVIIGTATPNIEVIISNRIKTNIGREFDYIQKTTSDSNGIYTFAIPYSTTSPLTGQTNFDTKPTGDYLIIYGNTTRQVSVNEEDVLAGEIVNV